MIIPNPIPNHSRVEVIVTGVVRYDAGGSTVLLHEAFGEQYATPFSVPREAIQRFKPPRAGVGTTIWREGWSGEVVFYDGTSETYVVRRSDGVLILWPDDFDVTVAADWDDGEDASPAVVAQALEPPYEAPPTRPAKPHGPNCEHTDDDPICDADGCMGEMPF